MGIQPGASDIQNARLVWKRAGAYHGGRLAEIKALPDDIRRYAGNGRYKKYRALGLSLQRIEQDRRDKAIEAAQPVLPKLGQAQAPIHSKVRGTWRIVGRSRESRTHGRVWENQRQPGRT